ncbi:MAG: hypothetical protein PHW50_02495 [Patescibacteria group bacterium]|nr:hypothetical protein [Patescibacteria group bacterium]
MKKEINWQIKLKSQKDFSGILVWGLGILIVVIGFVWIFQNYLGALAVAALGILYLRFYYQVPIEKEIVLSAKGVKYGSVDFAFSDFLFFSFIKIKGKDHVLFQTVSRNMPEFIIELPHDLQKDKIEQFLSDRLPRQKKINIFNPFHLDSYLGI